MENKKTQEYYDEFLLYKHSLGYIYDTQGRYLEKYIGFETSAGHTTVLKKETVESYLSTLVDCPGTLYGTVSALREFAHYLRKLGINAYIIPPKTVSQATPAPPYFFTEEELSRFFASVDSVETSAGYIGREIILPAFFRLMYCCGLRCKEARMLRCEDISLKERRLDVLQSKGPKSRRLYISNDLGNYLERYDAEIALSYPGREYFFPGRHTPYVGEGFVCGNFRRFWKRAFPDFSGEIYPRPYDLRHHFAWANINRWASEGIDVNAMLPYLMRYMGHQTVKQTLYYFHFVPDFYPTYMEMAQSSDDILPEVPE